MQSPLVHRLYAQTLSQDLWILHIRKSNTNNDDTNNDDTNNDDTNNNITSTVLR